MSKIQGKRNTRTVVKKRIVTKSKTNVGCSILSKVVYKGKVKSCEITYIKDGTILKKTIEPIIGHAPKSVSGSVLSQSINGRYVKRKDILDDIEDLEKREAKE